MNNPLCREIVTRTYCRYNQMQETQCIKATNKMKYREMQAALFLSNPFVPNIKLTLKAAAKHSSAQHQGRSVFDLK
jgi:hypothetical protein